jgi:hypothetical protein
VGLVGEEMGDGELGGAKGGDCAGCERHGGENDDGCGGGEEVDASEAVEQVGINANHGQREEQAEKFAEENCGHFAAHQQKQNFSRLRAERHANAHVAAALHDRIRHEAIDAHGSEQSHEDAEDRVQQHREVGAGFGVSDELRQRADFRDCLSLVERGNFFPENGEEGFRTCPGSNDHIAQRNISLKKWDEDVALLRCGR